MWDLWGSANLLSFFHNEAKSLSVITTVFCTWCFSINYTDDIQYYRWHIIVQILKHKTNIYYYSKMEVKLKDKVTTEIKQQYLNMGLKICNDGHSNKRLFEWMWNKTSNACRNTCIVDCKRGRKERLITKIGIKEEH